MTATALRALTAAATGAVLTLGGVGIATAQDDQPPGLVAQICAAASIGDVNALLAANLDVQLPAGVRDAVNPGTAAGPLDQVRAAAGCDSTPTPDPTPTDPPDPDVPFYEDCAAAIAAGVAPINRANNEPGYRAELDPDGDGIACEAGETGPVVPGPGAPSPTPDADQGTDSGGFSQLDDVPSAAAETGGGPA